MNAYRYRAVPLALAGDGPGDGSGVVTSTLLAQSREKADHLIPLATVSEGRFDSAADLADALDHDIGQLSRMWPRGKEKFSLPALKEFTDSIMGLMSQVVSMGREQAEDVINIMVAQRYIEAAQSAMTDQRRYIASIYNQAIIPAQERARRQGIPRSRWDEIVVEVGGIRDHVFRSLISAHGALKQYAFLNDIRPAILNAPGMRAVINGVRSVAAFTVAFAEASGAVVKTAKDLVTLSAKVADATVWASKLALAGGAAYVVWWALRSDKRKGRK